MNRRASVLVVIAVLAMPTMVGAREVDQFTDRLFQLVHLTDASTVIDARMNALLAQLAAKLEARPPSSQRERDEIVEDVLQGSHIEMIAQLRSPLEEWLRSIAPVDLFWVAHRGIYGGDVDYDDMGLAWYIENAPVIRIGQVLVGLDKVGHFLGQGWFYEREYQALRARTPHATESELFARVRAYGHRLELGYQGLTGTGVYSYADLAANWQGFLFYRTLWDGPTPYLVAKDGHYRVARVFHILDYATDAWDEATNPSRPRSDRFFDKVARYLRTHVCDAYRGAPKRFANASGRTQDPADYLWEGITEDAFACKRRWYIAEICR
jgi:hypothetical protein